MRPQKLNPLFADVTNIKGIGPRSQKYLTKLLDVQTAGSPPKVLDLLWHMPTGLTDRRSQPRIEDAEAGTIVTLKVRVLRHNAPPRRSKAPYRVLAEDESGQITLVFFRGDKRYLQSVLPIGEIRYVSGRVESYGEKLQLPHPDLILDEQEFQTAHLLEPVYPLTAGLSGKILNKAIHNALERLPEFEEWIDRSLIDANRWPSFTEALKMIHRPESERDISTTNPPRLRLAYDELLANQVALALVRLNARGLPGRAIKGTGELREKILSALPFALTRSQEQALDEIRADMATDNRMLRLLQGDVGSGKTVVALLTMVEAVEAGYQATLMAPTEVLARQHLESLTPLCQAAGIQIALLTGREKGRPRKQILEALAAGVINIVVGTHALFQDDVHFKDLGLAIIDEQHRFGVHQRLSLQRKGGGKGADVLVMTATPIPRTLVLTHYGDMEVSRLTEKPAGRKPIATRAVPFERVEEILSGLRRALQDGAQAYWICPLVDRSDLMDLAAADERHAYLTQQFGDRVGLVHGQMGGHAKDAVMAAFKEGDLSILVATTVVEVGVDVPNANIMVIEHAERFGLAQLHQLRGRVGRGERASSCVLLYHPPLGETARKRLEIMRTTEDGFVISEEDLRLRGGGELLGTRQSGLPEFHLANVPEFENLLETARQDAQLIVEQDAALKSPRGEALRELLYLFERDEAVRLFQAG